MIFLKDDILVERDITPEDIKPRLLGHWGTCPGLSLVYAHLNRIIRKTDLDALYVVGPGKRRPELGEGGNANDCLRTWCSCHPCLPLARRLYVYLPPGGHT